MIPRIHDMAVQMNLHQLRSGQIGLIYESFVRYLIPDWYPYPDGRPTMRRMKSDEDIEAFLELFNQGKTERFRSLDNIRFVALPEFTGEYGMEDKLSEIQARYHARFGADEVREIVAFADVEDERLYVAPVAARYGDRWYIVSLHSMINDLYAVLGNKSYSKITHGFAYGQDCPPEPDRR